MRHVRPNDEDLRWFGSAQRMTASRHFIPGSTWLAFGDGSQGESYAGRGTVRLEGVATLRLHAEADGGRR